MKTFRLRRLVDALCLAILLALTARATAQEAAPPKVGSEEPTTKPAATENVVTAAEKPAGPAEVKAKAKPHVLPKGIEEIVKMSEEGVSADVLTRYIEGSGVAYEPTGADLIAMKKRGVPDEVTVVMLARSSAIRAEYEASRRQIAAPAIVRTLSTDGQLDPESYEFFWYHHAYPRALAGSYQTLSPYAQPFYHRSSHKSYNSGPKWRTDGFSRSSFGASKGGAVRRRP